MEFSCEPSSLFVLEVQQAGAEISLCDFCPQPFPDLVHDHLMVDQEEHKSEKQAGKQDSRDYRK